MDWGSLFGNVAPVLGGASSNALSQDEWNALFQLAQQNAQLNRDRFAESAPGTRLSTSVRASNVAHASPTQVEWGGRGSGARGEVPTFTGGAHAALANMDPSTRALAQTIMADEAAAQHRGGVTGGGADRYMPPIDQPGSSWWEKLLGGGSFLSSLLGALGKSGIPMGGSPGSGGSSGSGGSGGGFDPSTDTGPYQDYGPQNPNGYYPGYGEDVPQVPMPPPDQLPGYYPVPPGPGGPGEDPNAE